jgi:hypothetical protein
MLVILYLLSFPNNVLTRHPECVKPILYTVCEFFFCFALSFRLHYKGSMLKCTNIRHMFL